MPSFNFLDSVINAKDEFIDFLLPFSSYVLYFFNIPVLKLAISILLGYFTFLATEYLVKLFIKYVVEII